MHYRVHDQTLFLTLLRFSAVGTRGEQVQVCRLKEEMNAYVTTEFWKEI